MTAALETVMIERCAGTDRMEIFVFANPESGQVRLCATLDNLGKGAAGAAMQNLNLMAGLDELCGTEILAQLVHTLFTIRQWPDNIGTMV